MSVFAEYEEAAYPFWFSGTLTNTSKFAGGTPSDSKVAEAWIRSKLGGLRTEEQLQHMASRAITERGGSPVEGDLNAEDDVVTRVNALKNLNGFKRHPTKGLYLEGRHLKACLKEAVSVCVAAAKLPARGWGKTNKSALSFAAEHIVVPELELYLHRDGQPILKADDVDQRFVATFRGTGIQYEEVIEPGAEIHFTVKTDWEYTKQEWGIIWLTAQEQGLGSSRSQGYGVFDVIRWDQIPATKSARARAAAPAPKPRKAGVSPAVGQGVNDYSAVGPRTRKARAKV